METRTQKTPQASEANVSEEMLRKWPAANGQADSLMAHMRTMRLLLRRLQAARQAAGDSFLQQRLRLLQSQ